MQARPSRSGGRFDFGGIKVIVRAGPTGWGPWARARLGVWGEELGQPLPFLGKAIVKKDDTEAVGGDTDSSLASILGSLLEPRTLARNEELMLDPQHPSCTPVSRPHLLHA